ncbi:beta-galactosidase [Corynebacterium choanae]|uniref:beta-galactosidase n=1 Tax=Corynebacterium choanae TaxID=1862358 RepID=A0A3G6J3S9_9CORY|nr:beta-galactosidase [Corynebacterium choanae]AZA12592.1 Beta-galactosidase bgaB [Corynebacterium choanae]
MAFFHPDQTVFYGGDYNPEQWDDPAVLAEDIRLMQEAKVNLVTLGVFAWAKLEPSPGQYEMQWLIDILDRLHAAGIAVDMATATASPPAWLAHKFPDSLPVDAQGRRLKFGSRQQYCPTSPAYANRARALVERLVSAVGEHPAIVMWHVNNEYGCHVHECFCRRCAETFQQWLDVKYDNDIDALNQTWGTAFWSQTYSSFDEIQPPHLLPTFANPVQVVDWRRFSDHMLRLLCAQECLVLREQLFEPPVITTNFMGLFPHLDYWLWSAMVGVVSDDSYPDPASSAAAAQIAFDSDLMRSLKQQPFILMEQAPSAVQWRSVNAPKPLGVNMLWSMQRIAHGADGIMHFQWRQSIRGAETFHSAMLPHGGTNTRVWKETVALGAALEELPVVHGRMPKVCTALLFSWESEWIRQSCVGPVEHEFGSAARKWHRTLFEAGYTSDFVNPDTVTVDELRRYLLVVVPELFAMDQRLADTLQQAAEAGVQIIIAGPSGVVDNNGKAHNERDGYPLASLTGVKVNEPWPTCLNEHGTARIVDSPYEAPNSLTDRITGGSDLIGPPLGIHIELHHQPLKEATLVDIGQDPASDSRYGGTTWAESLSIDADVEVWARYGYQGVLAGELGGLPAIVHRIHGAGGVTYVSFDANACFRDGLCTMLLDAQPGVRDVEQAKGVERVRRGNVEFLLNHGRDPVYMELMSSGAQAGAQKAVVPPVSAATIHLSADATPIITTYRHFVDDSFNTERF